VQRVPFECDLIDGDAEAERDDAEVMSAQPCCRKAEYQACECGERPAGQRADEQVDTEALVQDRARVRAEGDEAAVSERNLSAAAHQQIEAHRDDREDEELGDHEQPVHLALAEQLQHERQQRAGRDEKNDERVFRHGGA
jgi:hypothetical protein